MCQELISATSSLVPGRIDGILEDIKVYKTVRIDKCGGRVDRFFSCYTPYKRSPQCEMIGCDMSAYPPRGMDFEYKLGTSIESPLPIDPKESGGIYLFPNLYDAMSAGMMRRCGEDAAVLVGLIPMDSSILIGLNHGKISIRASRFLPMSIIDIFAYVKRGCAPLALSLNPNGDVYRPSFEKESKRARGVY